MAWGGFSSGNVFDSWDLNPLAAQTGVSRDDLAQQRDAFLQPLYGQYRAAANQQGFRAAEDDQSLYGDQNFRMFAQTGQTPAGTPAQQWNSTASASGPSSGTGDAFIKLLMQRAQQATAIGRDDPNVRSQVDPMTAQMERASRNYLDDIAEKAGGRPTNMQGEQRMAAERLGQQAGAFESQVIGREIGSRREEIAQALQLWGGQLNNDQRLSLERELALLNDRARSADRAQGQDQFLRQLALQQYMFGEDNDYRWAGL